MEEFLTMKKRKYGNIEVETVDQGATCNLCFVEECDEGWDKPHSH